MADGRQLTPTRSEYLELRDERQLIREGFEFLDEKRMILAQEMLRQLSAYRDSLAAYRAAHDEAVAALAGAVARHGLEGVAVYPRADLEDWELHRTAYRFLGVELIRPEGTSGESCRARPAALPSPEAELCGVRFTALVPLSAELSAHITNVRRLVAEYTRTERRARALENVMLPEIDQSIRFMEEQLEAIDQEEALRVRFADQPGRVG
jgi:V/A-type H+-transporting ATPase subunit D